MVMSEREQQPESSPAISSKGQLVVIGLATALLLTAIGVLLHALTTRSRDAVVEGDFIELSTPISGRLASLKGETGTAVSQGDPLAMVENPRASEAEIRRLETALDTAEADQLTIEKELLQQRRLLVDFERDAKGQHQLEVERNRNELDQLQADLARERKELAFSQRDLKRQEELYRAGAVAQNVVDRARTSLETNQEQVRSLEARIRAQTNRVQAAERNLNLDRTRGGTDPLPRLQETRIRLAQLEGQMAGLERKVKGLRGQLNTARLLYKQERDVWIDSPIQGVIWKILSRVGDTLKPDQPLLKLVNCQQRWVNTTVSESDLRRLRIGTRARIDLIGEDLDLSGSVDLIRSGVGRISGQNDDAVARPINLARQSEVRVRIDSDVPAPPKKLCFVGYSARVIFR